MFENFVTLQLKGGCFEQPTDFTLFSPNEGKKTKTNKGAVIYGKNGTGKSTIAKAFNKISGNEISRIESAIGLDQSSNIISLSNNQMKRIFVFDEDYINKNILLKSDHLDTIIMLGKAADLEIELSQAKEQLKKLKAEYDKQKEHLTRFDDERNIESPLYHINTICSILKADGNWAERDKAIHDKKINHGVGMETYKKFENCNPSKSKYELLEEYTSKLSKLNAARTGSLKKVNPVPKVPEIYLGYDDETIHHLLRQIIETPVLSDRERKLLSLVETGHSEELSHRKDFFSHKETIECPYCYQPLTQEQKESMIQSIEKVLRDEVKTHQEELYNLLFNPIEMDLFEFEELDNYSDCIKTLQDINAEINDNNRMIETKRNNPYEPIKSELSDIRNKINLLISSLEKLEDDRLRFNESIEDEKPMVKELEHINSELAFYDIKDSLNNLEVCKSNQTKANSDFSQIRSKYCDKKQQCDLLESKKKNVQIAIETINACLKYIFFTEHRLEIEYVDGVYMLLSHGKSVKPSEVSVGERNIIALCYFFTSILEGYEEESAYNEESLIIIDDPVSSYDIENRIGILSFLKYKLSLFLTGNINTKVLITTHDISTLFDLQKIFDEIMTCCKNMNYPNPPKYSTFELKNGKLENFTKSRNEYSELLKTIYSYGFESNSDYELVIGNLMRQALEAFSTFEFKKGIEDVSNDDKILDLIPIEYRLYYKNLMYRLVLHGGSHKEEHIKAMKDYRFFSLVSESEKRRTAKDILGLIYLLNRMHIIQHLKDIPKAEINIQNWCEQIKSNLAASQYLS